MQSEKPALAKGTKSIIAAGEFTGISRSGLYALMRTGRLRYCKLGPDQAKFSP